MKRLIFIILFSVTFVLSATEISTEFVSGTWTSGGSPYNVNCDIQIPDGETLSIEPGTEIVFQGHYWINVQGQILAEGTEGDNIIFRAENQEEGWMGVRFDQTPISNGPSNINYCHFSYGNANIFVSETGTFIGGAVYVRAFNKVTIQNSLFTYNRAGAGSAIGCWTASPEIRNNVFRNNQAGTDTTSGYGTIECRWDSCPKIWGNLIENNSLIAGRYGAGAAIRLVEGSNASIKNNIIRGNYIVSSGNQTEGIVMYIHTSDPLIMNNLIYDNYVTPEFSAGEGGALWFYRSGGNIINNTIRTNKTSDGAALFFKLSSPNFHNNIIRGNESTATGDNIHLHDSACDPNFYHNNIEGGLDSFGGSGLDSYTGAWVNNIDEDPDYVDNGNGLLFNLDLNSPCIDAGSLDFTAEIPLEDLDLLGSDRLAGDNIDIGAIESNYTGINNDFTPYSYDLKQNYPNPFNPETVIKFSIPKDEHVELSVYNINGQKIDMLVNSKMQAGSHVVKFDGKGLTSGIYFYRIKTNEFVSEKKMLLNK